MSTLLVNEYKRLGRGIDVAALAEELKPGDAGLEFLTGGARCSSVRNLVVTSDQCTAHSPAGAGFPAVGPHGPGPRRGHPTERHHHDHTRHVHARPDDDRDH
jgi:hypothetical protein